MTFAEPVRQAVMRAMAADPASSLRGIAKAAGLTFTVARNCLVELREDGLVTWRHGENRAFTLLVAPDPGTPCGADRMTFAPGRITFWFNGETP